MTYADRLRELADHQDKVQQKYPGWGGRVTIARDEARAIAEALDAHQEITNVVKAIIEARTADNEFDEWTWANDALRDSRSCLAALTSTGKEGGE